ncbi:MAG: thiamine phosphate synthase [Thermoguttaceae bacterium]|nr:thiamine phosphate synthase [Thermoguttaceae bacterium]
MDANILRLIDASANRAREGLRVVEDYVRFALDDALATQQLKQFRHTFTRLMGEIPLSDRLNARETRQDVGTGITLDSERQRDDAQSVLAANFTRIQESLRSLEEYSKVVCPAISGGLEQLRYDSYTIQKIVQTLVVNIDRFPQRPIASILDVNELIVNGEPQADVCSKIAADFVCLTALNVSDALFVVAIQKILPVIREKNKFLFVVDRCDIAVLAHADGVVLNPGAVSVRQARELLPPCCTVGVRVENKSDVEQAFLDGADWILVQKRFPKLSMIQARLES